MLPRKKAPASQLMDARAFHLQNKNNLFLFRFLDDPFLVIYRAGA